MTEQDNNGHEKEKAAMTQNVKTAVAVKRSAIRRVLYELDKLGIEERISEVGSSIVRRDR
jgi:hypothetical protein